MTFVDIYIYIVQYNRIAGKLGAILFFFDIFWVGDNVFAHKCYSHRILKENYSAGKFY